MLQPYQTVQLVQIQQRIDFDIFLFINTKSGGQVGMKFMELEMETTTFVMHGLKVNVSFFDQNHKNSREAGLRKLKASQQLGNKCRAIVCGGDGTVLWVVREIVDHGIRIHNVPIGIIPIGTGNDFSRVMGWGGEQQQLIGEKFETLKELVFEWIDADIVNFDIWSVELDTYQTGYFKEISNKQEQIANINQIRRSFTNYCSVGIDGRIGWSFDKKRKKSRALNLLIYGCVGIAESCSPKIKMDEIVMSMEQVVGVSTLMGTTSFPMRTLEEDMAHSANKTFIPSGAMKRQDRYANSTKQLIFNNQLNSLYRLKKGYQNLVALNIDSYMGGCHNIWKTTRLGITNPAQQNFAPQNYNDGIIEFVSWESEIGLALQRVKCMGSKITQGAGPFVVNFTPPRTAEDHIYLQVDGEFMKIYHPKQMIIERCSKIPQGFIRVLKYRGRKREDFQRT